MGEKLTKLNLLIDSGGSDALWLFESTHRDVKTPKRNFRDVLGEGLSGIIFGNRSRVKKIKLGRFEIEKPTVSFLDSTSTHVARNFKQRNGSLGGNILKRFNIWFDYKNNSLILKKNGSFKKGFNYNMSGIGIVYSGKTLVREEVKNIMEKNNNQQVSNNNPITFQKRYVFVFRPSFKINTIAPNSPADKAGLKVNDIILRINHHPIHKYKLEEIIYKFKEKENKKIKLKVLRGKKEINFEFRLEKRI
ncbi:PDZ domain-containing protein [Polaribacter sp.]|nr:PDZ domain-containing protein [Polaribacter sp.]